MTKKYLKRIKILFAGIWAIPIVLLLRSLRPFVLFRFGAIRSNRIGHFVADACEQKILCCERREVRNRPTVNWYWVPDDTSNNQWALMVKRELPVNKAVRYLDFWNKKIVGGATHTVPVAKGSRDTKGLFINHNATFSFTSKENERGRKWLSSIGYQEGEKFICVLVRDPIFLANDPLIKEDYGGSIDKWSYHDYRDSDIDTYMEGLEWLADQGVWVLRMGKKMAKAIKTKHARILDYSFSEHRSDFLDVWLFANCSFCISTATGPDQLSAIYDRSILYLNATPLGHLTTFQKCMWVPKNAVWDNTGDALKLVEILDNTFFSSSSFQAAGIRFDDLTSADIKLYIQEFWARNQGTWPDSLADQNMHDRFWETLEQWKDYRNWHGRRHDQCRVSSEWLKKQSENFLEN
ncbi:TIGR04372 family glycosyltransferase [Arenicellales bacterium IMCC57338]